MDVADHPTLFGSDEFYQLFRQQLLAMLVEKEYSEKVDKAALSYLYIPADAIVSADTATRDEHFTVWVSSLRIQHAFSAVSIPFLTAFLPTSTQQSAGGGGDYIQERDCEKYNL